MGAITGEHVEWVVVDRMRQMPEEAEKAPFTVTQSYALFSITLCWIMQRIRIAEAEVRTQADRRARDLFLQLKQAPLMDAPWFVPATADGHIRRLVGRGEIAEAPNAFVNHTAARFLKNLRDAAAHGDARTVRPFNDGEWLIGFTFVCEERPSRKNGWVRWQGEITLLRHDMQRIGIELARMYCDALSRREEPADEAYFRTEAGYIREWAA